jgi:hypothetical protein
MAKEDGGPGGFPFHAVEVGRYRAPPPDNSGQKIDNRTKPIF